jgi:hypothetical protein
MKFEKPWVAMSAITCVTILGLAGCERPTDPRQSPKSPSKLSSAASVSAYRGKPGEAAFAELAAVVPSSAGFFIDPNGVLTAYVTDMRDSASASVALRDLRIAGVDRALRSTTSQLIAVKQALYSFAQLGAWRDALTGPDMSRSGVIWVDLDEAINRVTVGVDVAAASTARAAIMEAAAAQGIPAGAVNFILTRPLRPDYGVCPNAAGTIGDSIRPLVGGTVLKWPGSSSCAMAGFIAEQSAKRYIITNSHVTATLFSVGSPPRDFLQGSTSVIGTESIDPGADCGVHCRHGDDAGILIAGGVSSTLGAITRTTFRNSGAGGTDTGSKTIDTSHPKFWIEGAETSITSGQLVQKIGGTTGWTQGTVDHTCVTYPYSYPDEHGVNWTLDCVASASYLGDAGDSGSPVFIWTSGDLIALEGIHFAHDNLSPPHSWFVPFTTIESDLGVLQAAYPVGTPSIGGSVSGSEPVITWSATTNASSYDVYRCDSSDGSGLCTYDFVTSTGSTSFTDTTAPGVDLFEGGTAPSGFFVSYVVVAIASNGVSSASSNQIYFDVPH